MSPREKVGFALLVLATWVLGVVFVAKHAYAIYDDAYIYFRYVDNMGLCPFRYNCSDAPVEGFTGPLYLFILALVRLVTSDLETGSQLLGLFCVGGAITAACLMARHLGTPRVRFSAALAVVALLALDHHVLLNAVIGMETASAMLVVTLLSIAAFDAKNRCLRTLVLLAFLSRPEFGLFVVFLPVLPRARSLRYLAPLALAIGVTLLGRWFVFHDWLPNTLHAKSGGTWSHFSLGAKYLMETILEFPVILLSPLALLADEVPAAARYLVCVTGILCISFLWSGGDHFHYGRFVVPLVPALTVMATHGTLLLALRARQWANVARALAVLLAIGLCIRNVALHHVEPAHAFENVALYGQVGRFLALEHPGRSVATAIAGSVSYFSKSEVIDLVGLTNREVALSGNSLPAEHMTRYQIGHERHATAYVLSRKPELIVTNTWQRRPFGKDDPISVGIYAEWLLVEEIRNGRAPYLPYTPEIAPGVFWLMFQRRP